MDILAELNPEQRKATEAISGPILILAGPGSGKTRVITHRIAYLIKVCGVSPYRIMAVTFTNKAAREMQSRLSQLLGVGVVKDLTLGTFHAICARILRRDGKEIGFDSGFVIYDDEDHLNVLKRSIVEIGLDPKEYAPRAIASAISAAKSHLVSSRDYQRHSASYFEEVVGRVYEQYQQALTRSNALDFDDLLARTVDLLRQSSKILTKYQERYLHIQVDEFQDTNLVQYELIKMLGGKYRNICAVGDPDQAIYSWRFADIRNILSFEQDYPDAEVVLLEQNYRSTKMILETASNLISTNQQRKPMGLWTGNSTGDLTRVIETYTEQEEAQYVVSEIERLVGGDRFKLGDFAVMYRTNAQSRVIEEAFIRYGVSYKLVAGTRFYERREVKDIIAYFKLVQNPQDAVSLLRVINVPGRGIGERTLGELSRWAKTLGLYMYEALKHLNGFENDRLVEGKPSFNQRTIRALAGFFTLIDKFRKQCQELTLVDLFDLVIEKTGYREYLLNGTDGEERWDNILELRTVAQGYCDLPPVEGLSAFLEGVTLVSDVDELGENVDAVVLITLHQSKGLEFPAVFIVGMEDGLLPHSRSFGDPAQMEEERRLCYVGITRARELVYLVRAFRRNFMGSSAVSIPSRFLKDIPSYLLSGGGLWEEKESSAAQVLYSWERNAPEPSLNVAGFKAGDHVHHVQFGDGVVVSAKLVKDDIEVVVAFNGAIKKLLSSYAKLKKME